jgi:hypothetical protein
MAQKRMFDKRVVESDKFTDLPNSSKALYFMAGMSADDKGFFQPRRLQRMCGFSDDDFKILIAKNFFITFPSGVMVVTDWNKNNWLDSRRITETEYVDELKLLELINEKYELIDGCLADAKPMLSQNRIEENRIEENNKEKYKKESYGEFKNVKLTKEEYAKLEKSNLLPYIEKLSSYIASKGKKYKSHYATILNWARKEQKELPSWFDKETNSEISSGDKEELENLLKEFE